MKFDSQKFGLIISFLLIFLLPSNVFAQELPDKIRGYKVHKAKIAVKTQSKNSNREAENKDAETFVRIGEPEVTDVSLSGITFELTADLTSTEQSGTVDFLTFQDIRVNGLKVLVEEYNEPFKFNKNQLVILPKPFKVFLGAGEALNGALKEMKNSKEEWRVAGRILVFGRFDKFIFTFKRVIPIDIDILIKNPLKNFAEDENSEKEK